MRKDSNCLFRVGMAEYINLYVYFYVSYDKISTRGLNELMSFQHKDYEWNFEHGYPNDVALIKLKWPVNPNNPYVKPVALDENNGYDWRQHECYAVGWGKTGKKRLII